jgi:Family of unknown function (DUF6427)
LLRFFKKNDPYRIIPIFLILIAIRAVWVVVGLPDSAAFYKWELLGYRLAQGAFMYRDVYDYTGPLAAGLYGWITFLFGTSYWPHLILSSFLVVYQAATFNLILLRNKAFADNNYLPAFLYVIFSSAVPEFYVLSPQLLSVTFLILTLGLIFRRIDNQTSDELFLLAGVYLALAMLFYLPAVTFFVAFLLAFVVFSTAIFRRMILFVLGMVVVVTVVWGYTFWFGYSGDFLESFFLDGTLKPKTLFVTYKEFFSSGYAFLAVFGVSLIGILWLRLTNFQLKIVQVMLFFVASGIAAFFLAPDLSSVLYAFLFAPAAFFLSHSFLRIRKIWAKILVPYAVVLGLIGYPAFLQIAKLDVYQPKVENKKLMVIGDDLSSYKGFRFCGPFLDAYVSERRLQGLGFYDEALVLYNTIATDQPDLIIDEWGYWENIAVRFPLFAEKYQKQEPNIYIRISN